MLKLKALQRLLKDLEWYNNMAPFPVYDTDYVREVSNTIDKMKNNKDLNKYDEEPVVCCKYCKWLHITVDNEGNDICNRCGSVNELETLDDIYQYLKKYDR